MYSWAESRIIGVASIIAALFFFLSAVTPLAVHAQTFLDTSAGVRLISNPQFPEPYARVEVTLDDYTLDTVGATITWYLNNVEQPEYQNERSVIFVAQSLGKETTVRVMLSRQNALPLTNSITITPRVVDLILEANTYVPNFYNGRALPSTESNIRAIAVVHDGSIMSPSAYSYRWKQGDTILFGGPIKGKRAIELTLPHYDNGGLMVEVFDAEGSIVGKKTVSLIGVPPELHFYEHSPLRGLSLKAVASPLQLIGEEATIYGEPYFMNTTLDEDVSDFMWTINGEGSEHDALSPNAITLRHVGGEGEALVGLTIVTKTQIPQFVKDVFQLFF